MAQFTIEIKDDGKICVETGDLSGQHHQSADQFLAMMAELMTGPVETKSTRAGLHHHHGHSHGVTHSHGGSEHTH